MNHVQEESIAARELRIWFRAHALCASAEPHAAVRPCDRHQAEARRAITDNTAPGVKPEAAERATAIAQEDGTR
jgi:hypothetical protein